MRRYRILNSPDDENIYGNINNNSGLNEDSSLNELKDLAVEIYDSELKIDINESQVPMEDDDLYQIGTIGFIKSIRNFDVNFEVRLSTYAVPYILGEIKRFLRDDGPIKISRSLKDLYRKIMELQKEWIHTKGREPTLRGNL